MSARELFLKYYNLAREENRGFLLEHEAAEVCQSYHLPLPEADVAGNKEEAIAIADKLGYPVVMKVVSPQVIHKSDVGGVRVGIQARAELVEAYDSIVESVKQHSRRPKSRGS